MKSFFYLYLAMAAFFFPNGGQKRPSPQLSFSSINWDDTHDWKLYYIHSSRAFSYNLDSLKATIYISLDLDSMKTYLKGVEEIPTERAPLGMGFYVCSCRLADETQIKIEISQYGRFFYYERGQKYYQLKEIFQDGWLSYLSGKWIELEDTSK